MFEKKKLYTEDELEQRLNRCAETMERSFKRCIEEKMRTITFLVAENQALRMELESLREKTEESNEKGT